MNNRDVNAGTGRLSFPGKILSLLLHDDQFYREIVASKRVSLSNFPKYDQWSDESGFFIEFALAGFAREDIFIDYSGNMLYVYSNQERSSDESSQDLEVKAADGDDKNIDLDSDEYIKQTSPKMRKGVIVRGIARRSFKTSFYISNRFNTSNIKATMKDGLLSIFIPNRKSTEPIKVVIG